MSCAAIGPQGAPGRAWAPQQAGQGALRARAGTSRCNDSGNVNKGDQRAGRLAWAEGRKDARAECGGASGLEKGLLAGRNSPQKARVGRECQVAGASRAGVRQAGVGGRLPYR